MKPKLAFVVVALAGVAVRLSIGLTVDPQPVTVQPHDDSPAVVSGLQADSSLADAAAGFESIRVPPHAGVLGVADSAMTPVPEPGVKYVPLDKQDLPATWKDDLREKLEGLKQTGSMSRGKVTHEFRSLEYMSETLQKQGAHKLRSQLAIQPTELGAILGSRYLLLGADVQAKQVLDLGFSGFFQVYSDPSTGQLVELSERQADVRGGDGLVIAPEFNNDKVGADPATFEALNSEEGAPIHNLQWVTGERTFHLSTKFLNADETRLIAQSVASRFSVMRFDGWRTPYELDVNNPLHRISRPGLEQPAQPPVR